MAELMSLALGSIEVPERLRSVSADHAGMLAADIKLRGLLQPVVVRGPMPGGRWVLLAGAHRLAAARVLGWAEIPAVAADVADGGWAAELVEIAENLFRNDLSALERAVYVVRYRAAWEVRHGRKGRGGDRRSAAFRGDADQTANMAGLKSEEQEFLDRAGLSGFAEHVADRLGLTERTVYRAQELIRGLHPELVKRLMGTAVADNQALLIRVSRVPLEDQAGAVAAIDEGTPVEDAVAGLFPLPEVDEHKPYLRAVNAWGRLTLRQRRSWVRENRAELARLLAEVGGEDGRGA
jgi:ParB family chromosome partitioning protein